jgi:IMP and pyridine-specific 5'-nucleotidase
LANYLCQLLRHGVYIAVVTAAGYEYNVEKYEFRLSGLLDYFKAKQLTEDECKRFFLFGGECNYLLHVSTQN